MSATHIKLIDSDHDQPRPYRPSMNAPLAGCLIALELMLLAATAVFYSLYRSTPRGVGSLNPRHVGSLGIRAADGSPTVTIAVSLLATTSRGDTAGGLQNRPAAKK